MSAGVPQMISLRRLRWSARAPRIAGAGAIALLALAGVRGVLFPPTPSVPAAPKPAPQDIALEGFATEFVRAYLTFDPDAPEAPEAHQRALSPFVGEGDLGSDAGAALPASDEASAQRVLSAQAVQSQPTVSGQARIVTVAAHVDVRDGPLFLAVTVARSPSGELRLLDYPALVGGPLATADAQLPDREDVEIPAIATLARRAIANYLRGDLPNLRADLVSDATVTLPAQAMRVEEIAAVQWASARREAVQIRVVAADETGATWTYSYELGVRQEASDWRIAWIDTLATET